MYRRRRFDAEIIELCVRWYITYRLSYRDLVAMMAERGIAVSHTTIHRWVIRLGSDFLHLLRHLCIVEHRASLIGSQETDSARVDEALATCSNLCATTFLVEFALAIRGFHL